MCPSQLSFSNECPSQQYGILGRLKSVLVMNDSYVAELQKVRLGVCVMCNKALQYCIPCKAGGRLAGGHSRLVSFEGGARAPGAPLLPPHMQLYTCLCSFFLFTEDYVYLQKVVTEGHSTCTV